jgi:hypothetical protein
VAALVGQLAKGHEQGGEHDGVAVEHPRELLGGDIGERGDDVGERDEQHRGVEEHG